MIAIPGISCKKLQQQGKCCWHCQYYVRQPENNKVDGQLGAICTVDRQQHIYAFNDQMNEGDKVQQANFLCNKFKFDLPPTHD